MKSFKKPCPFCGGIVRVTKIIEHIDFIDCEAMCTGCGMIFRYEQSFAWSKNDRVKLNDSFEELWNKRVQEG